MAEVSVIIPTYNRADLLRAAITSVLNQTFQDFEIIVVDDASDDHTPAVVSGFNDDRITYIRHDKTGGEAKARNTGVINSGAEYIAFLDDDDEWLPEKLELEINLLKNCSQVVGGVYTGIIRVDRACGKTLSCRIPDQRGDIYHHMIFGNVVGTPSTVLLRKECFSKVGLFDENIAYGLDYDMWIRISKEYHFECISAPLVKYYMHGNQISNQKGIVNDGLESLLIKYEKLFRLNRRVFSQSYFDLGYCFRQEKNCRKALGAILKAIKIYPFGFRNYSSLLKILGCYVLGPKTFVKFRKIKDRVMQSGPN